MPFMFMNRRSLFQDKEQTSSSGKVLEKFRLIGPHSYDNLINLFHHWKEKDVGIAGLFGGGHSVEEYGSFGMAS